MQSASLADYICAISTLPIKPMQPLVTPNQQLLFRSLQFRYRAISCWLKHLLLGEALTSEAIETDMKYYQASAEASAALFRLVVAVHPRSGHPDIRIFESPADLWLALEFQQSQGLMRIQGITGNSAIIKGKRAAYQGCIEILDKLSDLSLEAPSSTFEAEEFLNFKSSDGYLKILTWLQARALATAEPSFDQEHFSKYIKEMKRCVNKIKNTKELPPAWIDEYGELLISKKHQPLPEAMGKPRLM